MKEIDVDSARFVDFDVADAADVQSNFKATLPNCGVAQCELGALTSFLKGFCFCNQLKEIQNLISWIAKSSLRYIEKTSCETTRQ